MHQTARSQAEIFHLPFLSKWTNLNLMRPSRRRLSVQMPVVVSDRAGIKFGIGSSIFEKLGTRGKVNDAVDNDMRDMDSLRSKFPRK